MHDFVLVRAIFLPRASEIKINFSNKLPILICLKSVTQFDQFLYRFDYIYLFIYVFNFNDVALITIHSSMSGSYVQTYDISRFISMYIPFYDVTFVKIDQIRYLHN